MKRDQIKQQLKEYVELEDDKLNELVGNLLDAFHAELDKEKELTQVESDKVAAKEKELEEANKTIKNLNRNMKDPDEVQKLIDNYETKISDLRKEVHDEAINAYVTTQLTLAGAHDVSVCQLALDIDKSKIKSKDDYGLIDEAIKSQKKEKGFLFKTEEKAQEKTTTPESNKSTYTPRVGDGRLNVQDRIGKEYAKRLSEQNQSFSIKGVN